MEEDTELSFVTTKEVAIKFKISRRAVRDWIKKGIIRAINTSSSPNKARWRIPYSELQRLHAEAYKKKREE